MASVYIKGNLVISAGAVYDNSRDIGRCVAVANGGKVVRYIEDQAPLTDEEKENISEFVAEADRASLTTNH